MSSNKKISSLRIKSICINHYGRCANLPRVMSLGQMGGQGKPNGPPQAANGHGPIGGHGQSMNNDFKVEIEQQMEAELADLMEQQAQENENGRND